MAATFHKNERLNSKTQIDSLFNSGSSYYLYPLKLVVSSVPSDGEFSAKALFVVPKRTFKRANKRNLLKRRMRESYRLSKENFKLQHAGKAITLNIALLYTAKQEETFETINVSLLALLAKIKC